MPRLTASLLALVLAGVAAIALASCGEEDAQLLPGETAREITANLDTVQQLANEGDCIGAESAALQVSEQVEAVEGVDPKLKQALRDGTIRLNEVVANCEEETEAAVVPNIPAPETEAETTDEKEKDEKKEKDEEREEEGDKPEEEPDEEETEPSLPPQAQGEGKGLENGNAPDGEEGSGSPSGGVSPGSPAGEGE